MPYDIDKTPEHLRSEEVYLFHACRETSVYKVTSVQVKNEKRT